MKADSPECFSTCQNRKKKVGKIRLPVRTSGKNSVIMIRHEKAGIEGNPVILRLAALEETEAGFLRWFTKRLQVIHKDRRKTL